MQHHTRRTLLLRLGIQAGIALLLSFVITLVNHGFTASFAANWARGFVVAFLIIPLAMRLIPVVAAAARRILGNRPLFVIRCAVAIGVALMMEALIALVVILAQQGVAANWLALWGATFVKALPVGLAIGFTMTFLVQPWLQRLAMAEAR